jgi:hypothetical protein
MAPTFSADTCGRPSFLPCALARAMPANTRSRSMARSNSANTSNIENIALTGRRRGIEALPKLACHQFVMCAVLTACSNIDSNALLMSAGVLAV